jgi:hypothetical protein
VVGGATVDGIVRSGPRRGRSEYPAGGVLQ